ncbi:MAG: pyruvate ferredoxin oxidoreductase, partial [Candidatus Altiarchaeales archaeon]
YKPYHSILDPEQPLTLGPIGFPSHYMELRYSQVKALDDSINIIKEVFDEFSDSFPPEIENSRPERYYHVEDYKLEDAEIAFVAMGSVCGTIKVMVDRLRKKGERVGLLKLITYRPFPKNAIIDSLRGVKKVAVLEKAISPGGNGPVFDEIRSLFYDEMERPEIRDFIIGLGGRDVTFMHIKKIYDMVKNDKGEGLEWIF